MNIAKEVGARIKQLRQKNSMTQAELAKLIDTKQVNVSAWEIGTRQIQFDSLKSISEVFYVPMTYFFDEFADPILNSEDFDRLKTIRDNKYIRKIVDEMSSMTDSSKEITAKLLMRLIRLSEEDKQLALKIVERFAK